jgi:sugar phosphate isomerase/epimerase
MALVRIPAARISSTASVPPARAEAGPSGPRLANPFFAMNFAWYDAKISSSNKAQAALLKELGYDGCQYLGTLEQLREVQEAMDARGLQIHTAALRDAYNISVDPGIEYNPKLKDMIRALEGRPTLVLIGFVSRQYARSSPEGDARAAAIAGELADYARQFGLRVAIYPHVNQWCERVEHALRIANKADRKNLGICFNIYHWLKTDAQRNLAPLVAASMPRLFLVTINGTSPEGSMETLDRGSYDVYGFLKPFIEAGYNGPIGLQCVGVRGDARDNLQRSMNAWRSLSARFARRS